MKCPLESKHSVDLLEFSSHKLDAPRTAFLEEHLKSCSACREFVAGQRAIWQALDAWEAPEIPSDFDRRLFRRLEQKAGWGDRWLPVLRTLLVRQGLPIAAAACLILVAGLVSERPAPSPHPPVAAVDNLQPEQVEHVLDDMQMLSDFTKTTRAEAGEL